MVRPARHYWFAAVFCGQVVVAVGRPSLSVGDTLCGIFPHIVPCLMLLTWVASKTSGGEPRR